MKGKEELLHAGNKEGDGVLVDVHVINKLWMRFFWVFVLCVISLIGGVAFQMIRPPADPVNNFLSEMISLFSTTLKGGIVCFSDNNPKDTNFLTEATDLQGGYLFPTTTAGSTLQGWKTGKPSGLTFGGSTNTAGAHSHSVDIAVAQGSGAGALVVGNYDYFQRNASDIEINSAGNHSHTLNITSTGWDDITDVNHFNVRCYRIN